MTTAGRARAWGGWIGLALLVMVGFAEAAPKGGSRAKPKPDEPPALPAGTMELPPPASPIKLPAPVDSAIPGGGGKYLILHLSKLQQLAVFDVQQSKVVKLLPIASNDIVYAAGADK